MPPDCAQCETGYPRDARSPCGAGSRLLGIAYDLEAFGVCWHRTYSDVEGLEERCLPCPGDKNYTLVKVELSRRTLCLCNGCSGLDGQL